MTESSFHPLQSVEQLLAAAARHGLELVTEADALDAMGLDFLVVHARDADGVRWVVRSPRRAEVIESARVEARVLSLVRRTFPVAVPDWRVHAPDVIAYPRLDGIPAVTLDGGVPAWNIIDPAAPSATFLDAMAGTLVALHTISLAEAEAAGVPVQTIAEARASIARTLEVAREILAPPEAVWSRWQRWVADDSAWPQHVALTHGDLHPGHLLLEDDGRLAGILDWTEARVTDPSVDLAMLHMCFGRAALEEVVARFVRAGGTAWPRMIEHAIERSAVFPALGAEWAARTGNAAALDFARTQLAAQSA